MSFPNADARAVQEYRIAAVDLRVGDLVNTSPGDDDWQQVTGVFHTGGDATGELAGLVRSVEGRYVAVRLTDLAPIDGGIFFTDGAAMVAADDEEGDHPVSDAASGEDGERVYLFTRFELVTVRSTR